MAEFKRFDKKSDGQQLKIAERSSTGTIYLDYKRVDDLRRFLTPNGKIQSRKKSGLSAREQRLVAQAIKRARYMALMPYTSATL
ncbi:MAG: 30S ribosomal protein S18 [Phycisphaeraceae bacterium]